MHHVNLRMSERPAYTWRDVSTHTQTGWLSLVYFDFNLSAKLLIDERSFNLVL